MTGQGRRLRRTVAAMIVVGTACLAMIGWGVYRWVLDERAYRIDMGLRPFPAARQQELAQELLDELNTGDPTRVELPARPNRSQASVDRVVFAALPMPGCRYTLESVRGIGVGTDELIGSVSAHHTYRFDMVAQERCPSKVPVAVTIEVVSVPGMGGHWVPAALGLFA